ncbi:nad fad-binding protein [Moniliophthora roreri]|uniref:Amine oxidase domain-containing protein n=1 Tax=Moniliophthora roreri TaxID=221103 RepID=A0A0W0F9V2_MONRR|nr:nad fad-binding protein [Moniliophthora roreri]
MSRRTVKVAVIGSGLAGLTAAYLLSERNEDGDGVEYEVHLFEKTNALGMDSSSISLPIPGEEQEWRINVPMRSFQGGYYPRLIAFYRHLGISFRKADYSYSFSTLSSHNNSKDITASIIYNGRSGLGGLSIPSQIRDTSETFFSSPVLAKAWALLSFAVVAIQILFCYIRLLILSLPFRRPSDVSTLSFNLWMERTIPRTRISRLLGLDSAWTCFAEDILIPLFSAVCTCTRDDIKNHPMEEFLDYVWLTLGTSHYVAKNGVREVVLKLASRIPHIHLSSSISSIEMDRRNQRLVSIHCTTSGGHKIHSGFHHIIFATQAHRAIPILKAYISSLPPSTNGHHMQLVHDQIACLQHFKYQHAIVVNHTDGSLVPDNVKDRRELNIIAHSSRSVPSKTEKKEEDWEYSVCMPPSYTMATHSLPSPKGYSHHLPPVFQTTNPIVEPRNERILSVARLERAVLTLPSKEALKGLHSQTRGLSGYGHGRLGPLQGAGKIIDASCGPGIWICGSYAYSGIPLLEGCVVSARNVVEQGVWICEGTKRKIPW